MKLVLADTPPMQVLFMRGMAAAFWCLPLVFILGYGRDIHRVLNFWVLLRAAFEMIAVISFILALNHMPIGDITAIFQIPPCLCHRRFAVLGRKNWASLRTALIAGRHRRTPGCPARQCQRFALCSVWLSHGHRFGLAGSRGQKSAA